ncbi:MAG TPA: hypothetical protein VHU42_08225 [Rhodopila sp.]|jgi:hypothetical protein|nr:hypothetical protein [Rhodopila sp.]
MAMIATAGDLVTFALRTAGVNGVGQTPLAEDAQTGLQLLANVAAEWQRRRWLVWSLTETALVSTGAQTYTVGTGGDFPIPRPDRIDSAFARQSQGGFPATPTPMPNSPAGLAAGTFWNNGGLVCVTDGGTLPLAPNGLAAGAYWNNGGFVTIVPGAFLLPTQPLGLLNGAFWNDGGVLAVVSGSRVPTPPPVVPSGALDFPLAVVDAREDFNQICLKSLTTFPTAAFYESSWPLGVLHVWPVPPAGIYELHIATKAPLPSFANLTDPIGLPPEYMSGLLYTLANELAMNYGLQPSPAVVGRMRAAMNVIRMANAQIANLAMPAGVASRRGSSSAALSSPGFNSGWMS